MTWNDGGAYALLGPSGCGKTTLLNIISGLIAPTRGKVLFDGRDVTALAAGSAQHCAGVPVPRRLRHHDGVRQPRLPAAQSRLERVRGCAGACDEVAEILELSADLGRRARALSADQKQKISLGRGLVRPDVAAVLFDEPLTVIDPHLKWLLRRKLKQIHQQLKLSLLYVTHDQTEALTFADQVVVMSQGEIVQIGTPEQLFETPAHRFVGHFIGSPGMNFLACEWTAGARNDRRACASRRAARQAPPAGARVVDRRAARVSRARATPGPNSRAGADRRDPGPGNPYDGAARSWHSRSQSLAWAKLRNSAPMPALGHGIRALPAGALRAVCRRAESGMSSREARQPARLVVRAAGADQRGVLGASSR